MPDQFLPAASTSRIVDATSNSVTVAGPSTSTSSSAASSLLKIRIGPLKVAFLQELLIDGQIMTNDVVHHAKLEFKRPPESLETTSFYNVCILSFFGLRMANLSCKLFVSEGSMTGEFLMQRILPTPTERDPRALGREILTGMGRLEYYVPLFQEALNLACDNTVKLRCECQIKYCIRACRLTNILVDKISYSPCFLALACQDAGKSTNDPNKFEAVYLCQNPIREFVRDQERNYYKDVLAMQSAFCYFVYTRSGGQERFSDIHCALTYFLACVNT
jgi:hypothetical protein